MIAFRTRNDDREGMRSGLSVENGGVFFTTYDVPIFRLDVRTKKPNLKRSQKVPPWVWEVMAITFPPRLLRLKTKPGLAEEVGPWAFEAPFTDQSGFNVAKHGSYDTTAHNACPENSIKSFRTD